MSDENTKAVDEKVSEEEKENQMADVMELQFHREAQ